MGIPEVSQRHKMGHSGIGGQLGTHSDCGSGGVKVTWESLYFVQTTGRSLL